MTHKYVADLFSGKGGVAKSCRQLGLRTREWELDAGEIFDLVRLPVRQKLKQDIRRGRVVSVMLAPPCMSFSAARDRTSVIRDKDLPWGRLDTNDKDVQKMILGNQCMVAALDVIKECMKARVPWILEHPASSKAWHLPELLFWSQHARASAVTVDFCQFGAKWRKRTTLLCGNFDDQDIARLGKTCQGRSLCSRTGRKHIQLSGQSPEGVAWTKIAQPYPPKLCHSLAYSLTAHVRI